MATLKDSIVENFTRYAGNVILDRAICDARDMLKPAARELMYSQFHVTKNTADKPFVKSARVVGDCLGHYYTHGDSACYANYMRMSKPFAMRYPLEQSQGNSGTIISSNDEAAQRYTELRLSKIGTGLFEDINKDTIDSWTDNFDETETYPSVLPSKGFYNIVNGTTGIGVAISSSIPQFNLREINNALIKLLWDPDAPDSQVIVLPDFATGGILLNTKQVKESLKNGYGAAALLRSVIEYNAKERYFQVKELPYGVYTSTITEQLTRLLEEHPDCGINGINDGSEKKPNYIIYLTKDANPDKVLQLLYKETSLQSFFTINMTVLIDGRTPRVVGLRELLLEYLKHQQIVYYKGYEFDKKKIERRIHILDGLLICMANIDEVVHTIKNSNSTADAAKALQQKFLLDEEQTKAILDMKLSRLAHLEVEKLRNEKEELIKELERINAILNDEKLLKKEIEKDLRQTSVNYGDERRTKIENNVDVNGEEIMVKQQKIAVILTNDQRIKAINLDEYKTTAKATRGTQVDKELLDICCTQTNTKIILADVNGYLYPLDTNLIPFTEQGISVQVLCDCDDIVKMVDFRDTDYIITITKQGYIKKSLMSEYNHFDKKIQGVRLKENDEIVSILLVNKDENILFVNENNKVNNYSVEEIKTSSRYTYGTKATVVPISITIGKKGQYIATYTADGKAKKSLFEEFPVNSRTSSGAMVTEDTIGIANVWKNKIVVCGENGRIIICNSDDISKHSIKAAGARLMNGTILSIGNI